MANSTISMSFEIVDKGNGFKSMTTSAGGFKKMMEANVQEAKRLHSGLVNLASAATIIRGVTDGMNKLQDSMASLERIQRENIMTSQLLGNPEGISKLRNEVRTLCEYFGKDYADTIRGVNSLSKGFGITGTEAVSLMRDAMVSGADVNGDFIDTIREYPRYFKEAGISAEAFVAIATNAAKQGVFSDKGVDTIKEANLRLREMTKSTADALNAIGISSEAVQQSLKDGSMTTFEVMQQVAGKLKELPDSASEVGTAIADIFGGPGEDAGLEYIRSLADVQLNMTAVKEASGELAKQQEDQINTQIRLSGVFSEMKDKLANMTAGWAGYISANGSNILSIAANTCVVLTSMQQLHVKQLLLSASGKTLIVVQALWSKTLAASTKFINWYTAGVKGASIATATFKIALRSLMIASGVGLAIAAVTWAIEKFSSAADKAEDSAKELTAAQKTAKDASEGYRNAYAKASGDIALYCSKIEQARKTHTGEAELLEELNNTYGDTFKRYKTLGEWYDTLTTKGMAYCEMLGLQAEAEVYKDKVGELGASITDTESRIPANVIAEWEKRKTAATDPIEGIRRINNPISAMYTGMLRLLDEQKKSREDYLKRMNDKLTEAANKANELELYKSKGKISNPSKGDRGGDKFNFAEAKAKMSLDPYSLKTLEEIEKFKSLMEQLSKQCDETLYVEVKAKIKEAEDAIRDFGKIRKPGDVVAFRIEPVIDPKMLKVADIKDTKLTPISNNLTEKQPTADLGNFWEQTKNIASAMQSLKTLTDENATAWDKFAAVMDSTLSIISALASVMETVNTLQKVGHGLTLAGVSIKSAETTAVQADTNAKIGNAAAGFMAAHAWMPLVGIGLAGAAIGAMVATMFSLPKFAKGGIAYGPTLGLFGEYAGASHNPEVVAPLDKLKSLIGDTGMGGDVYFHINGDALEGVLTRRQRKRARG